MSIGVPIPYPRSFEEDSNNIVIKIPGD